jgi:hypothetical protein
MAKLVEATPRSARTRRPDRSCYPRCDRVIVHTGTRHRKDTCGELHHPAGRGPLTIADSACGVAVRLGYARRRVREGAPGSAGRTESISAWLIVYRRSPLRSAGRGPEKETSCPVFPSASTSISCAAGRRTCSRQRALATARQQTGSGPAGCCRLRQIDLCRGKVGRRDSVDGIWRSARCDLRCLTWVVDNPTVRPCLVMPGGPRGRQPHDPATARAGSSTGPGLPSRHR